jgi:ubiquinone/menaquinone biosynthesis C-methylase UbiE
MWPFKRVKKMHRTADVGEFYNHYNDKFLEVYGDLIQAFRTHDPTGILDYEARQMALKDGMKVIDAGCGVAYPALYFADKFQVEIDAVTISSAQEKLANQKVQEAGKEDQVQVHLGDYHQLEAFLPEASYDLIYFLESFGHSPDKANALRSAWKMLKPGGSVYIKDLFRRKAYNPKMQQRIDEEIEKINQAYRYAIADLPEFVDMAREIGFVLEFIQMIDIPLEEFENLTISNVFQELTGIGKIEDWDNYVFPVDFFEIRLFKPNFDLTQRQDRYFLQTMLYQSGSK